MAGFSGKSTEYLGTTVGNDGFFPDVALDALQKIYRLPTWYETEAVTEMAQLAMGEINGTLWNQQMVWIESGYTQLDQVPCKLIGDRKETDLLYQRAVACKVMGYIAQQSADAAKEGSDDKKPEQIASREQHWFSQARDAIKRLEAVTDTFANRKPVTKVSVEAL